MLEKFREEIRSFAQLPEPVHGAGGREGPLEFYDGDLRFVDAGGHVVVDRRRPGARTPTTSPRRWSRGRYLKSPYYKPLGYPDGIYRVGPLARLNVADGCGTPLADQEWAEFRDLERGAVLSSFHFHYARLIEVLHCLEKMRELLDAPDILDTHVRAFAKPNAREGVGVSEAPRGTLMHHYRINDDGLVTWANLIIATGHNTLAMNRGVLQVAKHFVDGETTRRTGR